MKILFISLLTSFSVYGMGLFEPDIQCTVIKVHKQVKSVLDFKAFPKKFHTINNIATSSTLTIAGKKFNNLDPKVKKKMVGFERIEIELQNGILQLDINGKPMSRNGVLKFSGDLIGDITCH